MNIFPTDLERTNNGEQGRSRNGWMDKWVDGWITTRRAREKCETVAINRIRPGGWIPLPTLRALIVFQAPSELNQGVTYCY